MAAKMEKKSQKYDKNTQDYYQARSPEELAEDVYRIATELKHDHPEYNFEQAMDMAIILIVFPYSGKETLTEEEIYIYAEHITDYINGQTTIN